MNHFYLLKCRRCDTAYRQTIRILSLTFESKVISAVQYLCCIQITIVSAFHFEVYFESTQYFCQMDTPPISPMLFSYFVFIFETMLFLYNLPVTLRPLAFTLEQ